MAAELFEKTSLVSSEEESAEVEPRSQGGRRRRVVAGGAVAAGAAAALVLYKSFSACTPLASGGTLEDAVVSLAESYPPELVSLAEVDDDADARKQWLEQAGKAKAAMEHFAGGAALPEDVRKAVQGAMQTSDPEEAKRIVDRAMKRAMEQSKTERRGLKDYIKANRRGLKGKKKEHTPAEQEAIATCVFDALSATTSVAGIAANLNDAAKTCWGVQGADLFRFGLHGKAYVHTNVCSVNVWAVLGGIIGLSSTLSTITSDCANTMIPNVNALCATSITGVISAVAGMGGASTLVKAACHAKGWYHDILPGALPSNVGNNEKWVENHPNRKAQYEKEMAALEGKNVRRLEEEPAPARQLLFGGGKGSTATQCSIEIANTMWALAAAAFAINSGGNLEQGGSCPPKNFLTGSTKRSNSILFKVPEAMCTIDVTSAILGFLSAITYIELAAVNCIDTLNLGAICGAGITGLMAAATGVAKASTGLYVTCDVAQKKPLKRTINFARNVDTATGGMLSNLLGGGLGTSQENFGRRLKSIAEEHIEDLKQRFVSPHAVFESLGVDLEDKHAIWRNMTASDSLDVQRLASLLEAQDGQAAGLFGGSASCSQ